MKAPIDALRLSVCKSCGAACIWAITRHGVRLLVDLARSYCA